MSSIVGRFENRVALIHLSIGGEEFSNVVVDTGYSGALAVTPEIARRLGALLPSNVEAETFADGWVSFPSARISVEWFGREIELIAVILENQTIIGMDLLYGTRMVVDEMNGVLTIEPAREGAA